MLALQHPLLVDRLPLVYRQLAAPAAPLLVDRLPLDLSTDGPLVAAKPPPAGYTYTDQEAICLREGVLQAQQAVGRQICRSVYGQALEIIIL